VTRQQDQAVKPEVGKLRLDAHLITILRGHDRLGGLLADLLDDRVVAFREQRRDVGFHRVGIAMRLDLRRQAHERVFTVFHRSPSGP
jgi:hypothetical protein